MTSDYLSDIGLGLNFNATTGLKINVKSEIGTLQQSFLGASNILGSTHKAQLAPFAVEVNNKVISNNQEEYPVLLFKDITYFPMTWRFAVTEFGWTTGWDDNTGFSITVTASNTAKNIDTEETTVENDTENTDNISFEGYKLIEVDGGNLSGHREPNVVVDIGFGDREYYAFTNVYGQLIKVVAAEITLQNESTEKVLSTGRYYYDEAKVPGVESSTLDEGHVIADSLGGVANAYNITPQNSTLNRYGDQAYMENIIRSANGCTDFTAIITYPNTTTQIPNHYSFTYTLMGNVINDEFELVGNQPIEKFLEEIGKIK